MVVLGKLVWGIDVKNSLSDYYNANEALRDWFVGYLFAIGFLLVVYRGFTGSENIALNLGGICLIVVAMVPTGTSALHGWSAILFFVFAAYVALWEAQTTVTPELIKSADRLKFYQFIYPALSFTMIAIVVVTVLVWFGIDKSKVTLVLEWAGVWAFGVYLAVKTKELADSDADAKVINGEVTGVANPSPGVTNPGNCRLKATSGVAVAVR